MYKYFSVLTVSPMIFEKSEQHPYLISCNRRLLMWIYYSETPGCSHFFHALYESGGAAWLGHIKNTVEFDVRRIKNCMVFLHSVVLQSDYQIRNARLHSNLIASIRNIPIAQSIYIYSIILICASKHYKTKPIASA